MHYRGQVVALGRRRDAWRRPGRRAPAGPDRLRRGAAQTRARRRPPGAVPAGAGQRRLPDRHGGRATSDAEFAAAAGAGGRGLPHPGIAPQPDGAARDDRPVGRRPARGRRLQPGQPHGAGARSPSCSPCPASRCGWSPSTSAAASAARAPPSAAVVLAALAAATRGPAGPAGADPPADVLRWSATAAPPPSGSGSAPTPTAGCTPSATTRSARPRPFTSSPSRRPCWTRSMYAARAPPTTHRLVRLDVPDPVLHARARRGPGLVRAGVGDGRARREAAAWTRSSCAIRNDTDVEPRSGLPFSSRNLVACLREGARRFGWADRDPRPGRAARAAGCSAPAWPAAIYPARARPSTAAATAPSRTAPSPSGSTPPTSAPARGRRCWQVAADALEVPAGAGADRDRRQRLPAGDARRRLDGHRAPGAGRCARPRALREQLGRRRPVPPDGHRRCRTPPRTSSPASGRERRTPSARSSPRSGSTSPPARSGCAGCSGIFAAGRIVNPLTARSPSSSAA